MRKVTLFLINCLLVVPLFTQEKPLPLEQLVRLALERNPKIKAADREAESYSYKVLPARTLPDPMLELGWKNMGMKEFTLGMDPQSGLGLSLSQTLPFPGKLKLKGQIATSAWLRKQEELEAIKRDVIRELKSDYYELFFVSKSIEVYHRQKDLLIRALKLSEEKYAVGAGVQSDILKAMTEISKMDEMIIPMREMAGAMKAKINLLLDFPADHPMEEPSADETIVLPDTLAELQTRSVDYSPMVREAKLMEVENKKMVAMARKEFFPDFRITAGWEYKGGLPSMFEAMIGLEIPFYQHRRQANLLREAKALESSARENVAAVKNDILAMLSESYVKAKTAESLVALYKNQLRTQARLTVESSLANYPVGKIDFLSLLMDIGNQFSVELAYYRELAQFWTALAAIESVTAKPAGGQ